MPVKLAMSFLTAATSKFTLRAGITAAAGTRLALLLLLVNGFRLYSSQILFQFGPSSGISRHYFDDVSLSNFRSCCLPWKWRQCIRPPLRDQTLIFRYPSISFQSRDTTNKLIDQFEVRAFKRATLDSSICTFIKVQKLEMKF